MYGYLQVYTGMYSTVVLLYPAVLQTSLLKGSQHSVGDWWPSRSGMYRYVQVFTGIYRYVQYNSSVVSSRVADHSSVGRPALGG